MKRCCIAILTLLALTCQTTHAQQAQPSPKSNRTHTIRTGVGIMGIGGALIVLGAMVVHSSDLPECAGVGSFASGCDRYQTANKPLVGIGIGVVGLGAAILTIGLTSNSRTGILVGRQRVGIQHRIAF